MRINKFLITEVITIFICTLAATFGPYLWINAVYKSYFTLSGLINAVICSFIYQAISALGISFRLKINKRHVNLLGISFGTVLLFLLTYLMRHLIFDIQKGIALLNYPIILSIVILFVVINYWVHKSVIIGLYRVSIYFLLPMVIILLFLQLISSGEGQVLLGNVAIVYYFTKEIMAKIIVERKESNT